MDHIIDHKGDMDLFLDKGNLQTLCARCHGRKSMEVIRMRNFKKDSRIVNITINPESNEIEKLKDQLGYDAVSPELIDTVVKGNTNDKFVAKDLTQAELIARRYALKHGVNPKFNYIHKGKDEQK